ncbi:unnamed protein product [Penicillium discolor]
MTDACDALAWVRSKLPYVERARQDVQLDADRVTAIGFSSGGHLAMTPAYTAPERGLKPPGSVLAFYCPSNFEAEWWKSPIYPKNVHESPDTEYNLREGIHDTPVDSNPELPDSILQIVGYTPSAAIGAPMTLKDPRWRIVIHYNWKAQIVPLLVNGLSTKARGTANDADANIADYLESLSMPPAKDIQAVSPYVQIIQGWYRTPIFLVHGDRDDLIPWEQSRDSVEALVAQGIEAGFTAPHKAGHAFDLWPAEDTQGTGWAAVKRAVQSLLYYQ